MWLEIVIGLFASSSALHAPPHLPGPRAIFPFSAYHLLRAGDFETLISNYAALYGPISRLKCRQHDIIVVTSPDLVREVTVVQHASFPDREHLGAKPSFPGIVTATGASHEMYRTLLNPSYFSVPAVESQLKMTMTETLLALNATDQTTLQLFLDPGGRGVRSLVRFVQTLALRIQYRSIFNEALPVRPSLETLSKQHTRKASRFVSQISDAVACARILFLQLWTFFRADALTSHLELMRAFTNKPRQRVQLASSLSRRFPRKRDWLMIWNPKFKAEMTASDPLRLLDAEAIISRRKLHAGSNTSGCTSGEWQDVLSVLHGAEDLSPEAVTFLTKDLIAAGADTTASAVTMTLFELIKDAQAGGVALTRVQEEAAIQGSEAPALEFTTLCVKEALRLHPPAPLFFRVAAQDTTLGGFAIRKGAAIVMSARQLGRDKLQWGSDAEMFKPERFLKASVFSGDSGRHPFSYLPFSAGPRACLGGRVAMAEVPAIVSSIVALSTREKSSSN